MLPPLAPAPAGRLRNPIANCALAFAMLAFFMTLAPGIWQRLAPPVERPLGQSLRAAASALSDGFNSVFSAAHDVPPDAQPATAATAIKLAVAASLSALLAILLAAVAFIQREESRRIVVSVALACAALAYGFEIKMLSALLAALLVMFLLGRTAR